MSSTPPGSVDGEPKVLPAGGDGEELAAAAAEVLESGGVLLVPTDTVYGLMVAPGVPEAAQRVYAMKRRPREVRLPIIVADLEQARDELPLHWNAQATALARAFWPGALTIACGIEGDAGGWLAGRDEVAVRAPAHALIERLARRLGPLLMTSANRHGGSAGTAVGDVLAELAFPPDLVVDGGTLGDVSSTLVNTNLPRPEIEREGAISAAAIAEVLADVR